MEGGPPKDYSRITYQKAEHLVNNLFEGKFNDTANIMLNVWFSDRQSVDRIKFINALAEYKCWIWRKSTEQFPNPRHISKINI